MTITVRIGGGISPQDSQRTKARNGKSGCARCWGVLLGVTLLRADAILGYVDDSGVKAIAHSMPMAYDVRGRPRQFVCPHYFAEGFDTDGFLRIVSKAC